MERKSYFIRQQLTVLGIFALLAQVGWSQFSSGSTGADGALNVVANQTVALPPSGILNYTTINVGVGATLTFTRNATNTPAILLATGNVTITGAINIAGSVGVPYYDALAGAPGNEAQPGPGGFPGGIGAVAVVNGGSGIAMPGGGPGGGLASTDPSPFTSDYGRGGNGGSHFTAGGIGPGNAGAAAPTYGDPRLLTLSGGSGGAGGNDYATSANIYDGSGGGAGGGGILIASSGSISFNGAISANGGGGGGAFALAGGGSHGAGGGAGGTIRLIANSITGSGSLTAVGGGGSANGGDGKIFIQAFSISGTVGNNTNPPGFIGVPTVTVLNPADIPTVRISAIGGLTVPNPATGNTSTPDVTIPSATANPISIGIVTTNIPNGAVIKLRIVQLDGTVLSVNSNAVASNAATASATLTNGVGVIYATASY